MKDSLRPGLAALSSAQRASLFCALQQRTATKPAFVVSREPRAAVGDGVATFPLSYAQQRMWSHDLQAPGSIVHVLPTAVRMNGALDVTAFERALRDLFRRHEILRTTFAIIGGEPRQVVSPDVELAVPLVDLRGLNRAARLTESNRLALNHARRPFDLGRGPLLRAMLVRVDEQLWTLLLAMHHIITDGWSMAIVTRELTALYESNRAGVPAVLPELVVQFGDFASWQRRELRPAIEQHLTYWRNRLAGAPTVLELPTDQPRPAVQTHNGAVRRFLINERLASAIKALSRQEDATPFMTLLAAFAVLLARYSGQPSMLIGTPIANRRHRELEALIGCFANILVLRVDVARDLTARQLLRQVRTTTLDAYDHQDVPLELLVETLSSTRDQGRPPLVQVMFQLQNVPREQWTLSQVKTERVPRAGGRGPRFTEAGPRLEARATAFDISMHFLEASLQLRGAIEYNTDLFAASTIVRMAADFRMLLTELTSDPDAPVGELRLLTDAERTGQVGA
jgi:hypothetical protein